MQGMVLTSNKILTPCEVLMQGIMPTPNKATIPAKMNQHQLTPHVWSVLNLLQRIIAGHIVKAQHRRLVSR